MNLSSVTQGSRGGDLVHFISAQDQCRRAWGLLAFMVGREGGYLQPLGGHTDHPSEQNRSSCCPQRTSAELWAQAETTQDRTTIFPSAPRLPPKLCLIDSKPFPGQLQNTLVEKHLLGPEDLQLLL